MNLNLPFLYRFWFIEYCQPSPNKNKTLNLWHITSILVCCIFAEDHHKNIWYSHVKCGSKFSNALAKAKFYNFRLQDEGSIKTNALNHRNRLLYSLKLLFPMFFLRLYVWISEVSRTNFCCQNNRPTGRILPSTFKYIYQRETMEKSSKQWLYILMLIKQEYFWQRFDVSLITKLGYEESYKT